MFYRTLWCRLLLLKSAESYHPLLAKKLVDHSGTNPIQRSRIRTRGRIRLRSPDPHESETRNVSFLFVRLVSHAVHYENPDPRIRSRVNEIPLLASHLSVRGRGGLVVRSRLWDRRVPGSKPDSTEDPPCMGPVAR
ncbi:hypothetical protein AVEN_269081-1 [Araneus ventricosus]|uniref:DUF4817 domain-containing protein n=1 Tax=Araneus ventricosus TaxID=182803 RepID=A0A4Y2BFH5_ARAVE|nr:hypothetical protein AVEN_269081-1 [Araneus ventricosus]